MADRRAVVQERLAVALAIPLVDRHRAAFQLERGGHAVARLKPVALERLRMRMGIDEAGRDDEPGDIDHASVRSAASH